MKTDYELALCEHYMLCINFFPYNGQTIATALLCYEDLYSALNAYLYVFLHLDYVKSCTIHKHVPHVFINYYLAHFSRRR